MADAGEISAMLERRRSYIVSNRIVLNPHRVTFGQPRNTKVEIRNLSLVSCSTVRILCPLSNVAQLLCPFPVNLCHAGLFKRFKNWFNRSKCYLFNNN